MTVKRGAVHGHGQAGGSCWQERVKGTAQVLGASVVGGFPVILLQQAPSLLLLLPVLQRCKPTRQPAACFWFTSGSTSTWACSNLPRKHTCFPAIKDFPEVASIQQNSCIKRGGNQAAEVWSCHNAKNPTTHEEFMPAGFPAGWPKLPFLAPCARDRESWAVDAFAFSLSCSLFSSSLLCCCSVPLATQSSPLCSSALPLLISPSTSWHHRTLWHFGTWHPWCFSGNPPCSLLLPRFAPKASHVYAWRKAGFYTPPCSKKKHNINSRAC